MARALRIEFPGAIYHVTVRRLGSWEKEQARLSPFGGDPPRQFGAIHAIVETGLAEDDKEFRVALKESPTSIGSEAFRGCLDRLGRSKLRSCGGTIETGFSYAFPALSVCI